MAFAPDGKQVLTGSWDKTARLWDAQSGKELRAFTGHADIVGSVAFSPDGKQVLTGSLDKTARLWDAQSGKELRTFTGHARVVGSVAFSPDGKQVLTGSGDKTARLWDARSGKELRAFKGRDAAVLSVAFSPDGNQVLTGSFDNTARLWDARERQGTPHIQGALQCGSLRGVRPGRQTSADRQQGQHDPNLGSSGPAGNCASLSASRTAPGRWSIPRAASMPPTAATWRACTGWSATSPSP